MATLQPFRGLRFVPQPDSNLGKLICPPYDVISPDEQDALYARHPHNVIRLELPRETGPARYASAAATFVEWRTQSVLRPDSAPCFYVYQQRFTAGGVTRDRRGIFVALKLEPWSSGQVLPHEETLPSQKADRMQMLAVCQANFSPIFGLLEDPQEQVQGLLAEVAGMPPAADFVSPDGHGHSVWALSESSILRRLGALSQPCRVFVADGHHRYETALEYRAIRRSATTMSPDEDTIDYVLAFVVPLADPGLVVLPTHRLLPAGVESRPGLVDRLLAGVDEVFTVRPLNGGQPVQAVARLLDEMQRHPEPIRLGVYGGRERGLFELVLRDSAAVDRVMPPGASAAWRSLDVAVLHRYVLEQLLGLAHGEAAGLTYTRDEAYAIEAVDRGGAALAVFVRGATPDQVRAVALAGERMPEKSTYFFPKVPTGLVIRALDLR